MKLNLVFQHKPTKMPNLRLSLLALILAVYITSVVGMQDAEEKREKRSLLQFRSMLKCSGLSWWDLNGYGCYCGLGGRGRPVDATDRCCQTHDRCYDRVKREKKCNVYWTSYRNHCNHCDPISTYPSRIKNADCRYRVCKCDSDFVACVKSTSLNPFYKHYSNRKC